jgi:glycosyltransferase involved in cell wall biosynthesis
MTPTARRDDPSTVVYAFLDFDDGGAQRLTLQACRHLDRARYRPVILCGRGGGSLVGAASASGVPVVELGRLRRGFDVGAVPAIARSLRGLRADVVHVPLYSRASPYVRTAALLARVPLVVAHEWCRPQRPRGLRLWADRALARGSWFVAASNAQARELVAEGVAPSCIEVVYSGIDVGAFSERDRAEARNALALPQDRPIVLVPARLHPMKGHVDLVAAAGLLTRQAPDVLMLCAGDGPLRAALPALARAAGLENTVRFLGRRDDMARLYGACDVVSLSSHMEGVPSVVMEAFASMRAVVATAVGGVPEIVFDGDTGWLVAPRRPDDLASALADALAHPAERIGRAARGNLLVGEQFESSTTTDRLQDVYDCWRGFGGRSSCPPAVPAAAEPGRFRT